MMRFFILDVFAEQKYAGNQLAVFLGNPADEVMQQLALEMNYSETTFITSDTPENGGYNVRIFMPNMEIPFAGHPTLGTATIIREKLMSQPANQVLLNLQVGQIPVTFQDDGVAWMQQNPPVFGRSYEAEAVADMLNLTTADIDRRFPIQDVSTGLPFTIVPLKTLDAVKRARMDVPKLRQLLADSTSLTTLIFSPEPYEDTNDLNCRVLEDIYNLHEDPATGSANGCLASYLVKHRYFASHEIDIAVEQGYEIQRPSRLYLRANRKNDEIEVHVGGRVVLVAEGKLL